MVGGMFSRMAALGALFSPPRGCGLLICQIITIIDLVLNILDPFFCTCLWFIFLSEAYLCIAKGSA